MRRREPQLLSFADFVQSLRWLDGSALAATIEPYRWRIFEQAFNEYDEHGRARCNLVLCGRAKKNWKSTDLVLAALYCLLANESPGGNQVYLVANDEDQAGDDLELAKKLIEANPVLAQHVKIHKRVIERKDGKGFLEVLAAGDVVGLHGKTYRFVGFDEIHGYRTWDVLEALQPDPTRHDAQQWITSYASIYHRPGVPLFDLCAIGRSGSDPRMLYSWYAADYTTDPEFTDTDPETRANPSRASWANADYLDQQRHRLPAHKFRRLHLNLPGLPEGSAFAAEKIMAAVERGVARRAPIVGINYRAFVDMSGGSIDAAVLAIGHKDADGRAVLDLVLDQGAPPPFDPRLAVARFARTLREYGITKVTGDRYAGETFRVDFDRAGIAYEVATANKTELYEALEPNINAHDIVLPDVPLLEQELLGLIWRGGHIDHPSSEHDDHANAAAGVVHLLLSPITRLQIYACGPDEPHIWRTLNGDGFALS